MIEVGSSIPDLVLTEFNHDPNAGCALGPNPFSLVEHAQDKLIVAFAVPGAFTPTCSEKHVPGYVQYHSELVKLGVDDVWCLSVNDPFVMGAWGAHLGVGSNVRMLSDGNALFTKAIGLECDLSQYGMGIRSQRYSLVINRGVVTHLNVEQPGKFEVSDAQTMLNLLQLAKS